MIEISKTIMFGHNLVLIHVLIAQDVLFGHRFVLKNAVLYSQYKMGFHAEGLTYDGRLYTRRILWS